MSVENPAVPLSSLADGDDTWDALTDGGSGSGAKVNRRRALGHSAVWRGVNLIAGDVGRHTFRVYRYAPGGGLIDAPEHPAARMMRRPNDYMTPFTFRQTLQAHALVKGNGYAYIFRNPDNARPLELLPLNPDHTWPVRANGELWYVAQCGDPLPGKRRNAASYVKIRATDVIHVKGLGFDGLMGYDVLKVLRETVGGALAARDYGSRYFRNNASPGVVLEVPAGMKDTAITVLRDSWAKLHQGFENAHRPAILRDGVKLAQWSANAKDAQLLENRQFDSRDIANVLGVPPHKVGDPSRTAYNSLESENQGYHEDTLGRWFTCWEQECDAKLLTELEKETESHCCRFDPRPLSRVGLAARTAYYVAGIQNGWLNKDEVRAEEGKNPIPDGKGKVYLQPVNLAPVGETPAAPPATEPAPITESQPEGEE